MSILLLYMMIASYFDIASLSYWLTVAAACAVPLCLLPLRKKTNIVLMQCVMIIVSFIITMIYGSYVTANGAVILRDVSMLGAIMEASAIAHGLSLITVFVAEGIHRWKANV